jgi:hypothetical protein
MTASPILGITQVSPSQNNKEVTINTAVAALESAMNAAYAVNLTSGDVTLTATQFASAFMFICSGNTVARNLIVPLVNPGGFAQSRMFCVNNSGSYDLVVKGSTGATATVPATSAAVLFCDGTNVFLVSVPVTVGSAAVLSVAGLTGTITLAQLVTAGLAPSANAAFTGTFSAPSGATGSTPSANDNSTKLATTAYVDAATAAIVQGLDTKAHVRALAISNVSVSSAPSSIDGVTLASGDRVALIGQTTGSQNGLYTFEFGFWVL